MKQNDLLEIMGEIDPQFIEDAARGSRSPKLLLRRFSGYAGAAAAVLILGFSAFVIYGVIRDGIAQQNQQPGYTGHTASLSGTDITETENASVTTTQPAALPSDEFVEVTAPAQTTAVTTTTALILTVPADMEMPDASLDQEIGDRISVNWLSKSGVLAMTVEDAAYYESFEDAGLKFEDLMEGFRTEQYYSIVNTRDENGNKEERLMENKLFEDEIRKIKDTLHDRYFVKVRVKIENVNAVSLLSEMNGIRMPDDMVDINYARDYDFDSMGLRFFTKSPDEEYNLHIYELPAYFSAECEAYPGDESRGGWFYLPPGESTTFEIGAFVLRQGEMSPRRPGLERKETDVLPYCCFGCTAALPYVNLHFADSSEDNS